MNKIIINQEDSDKRLDLFLVEKYPELSRTKIQKLIKGELIKINDKLPTVHQFLKVGDVIIIESVDIDEVKKLESKKPKKIMPAFDYAHKIKIIEDNENYLIIEKPSGLLVHPTEKGETNTLVDWVVAKYPECKKIGEDPARAAIVHRLDKEVSGLMVIPKTQAAFEHFKKLFKLRQVDKKYLALVYGRLKNDTGEINFPIKRSKGKAGLFSALPAGSEDGKKALTIYNVKEKFKNYTLLEVEIMTGRTHQIRVHLLGLGHGIVGDPLYKNRGLKEKINAERIFLHAASLGFKDLSDQRREYESPLPRKLKDILEKVK